MCVQIKGFNCPVRQEIVMCVMNRIIIVIYYVTLSGYYGKQMFFFCKKEELEITGDIHYIGDR